MPRLELAPDVQIAVPYGLRTASFHHLESCSGQSRHHSRGHAIEFRDSPRVRDALERETFFGQHVAFLRPETAPRLVQGDPLRARAVPACSRAGQRSSLRPEGNFEIYDRDLAGAGGWLTLNELLHTLNASIDYAVLRNFEDFPDNATMEGHGDVDLLCANTQEMAYIANASPLFQEPYRVLHQAMVGGKPILFDFRAVGDNYYDPVWAKDMIDRRVFSPKGFYHLGADDHFHSLLYHAAVHKPSIAPDYVTRLIELSRGKADLDRKAFADPSALRAGIDRFFSRSKYRFVEPDDLSVYFNAPFARIPKLSVNRVFTSSRSLGAALRTLFEQTEDCSTASSELQDSAFRLPSLTRFFSPTHGMLIEAIGLPSNSRVLEVGAETGALTRVLGERFRQVTALG